MTNWRGVSAHPSLSDADLDKLSDLFGKMTKSSAWQKILAERGWNDLYLDRAGYAAFQRTEEARLKEILQDIGMLAQQ